MTFETAFKEVLRWEGGYNEHPNDKGGATNFGISLRFYQEKIDPMATNKTILALKKEDAQEIYKKFFWDANGYDRLPHVVGVKMFSFAVNMGAKRANKLLQRAIRAAGKDIKDDGIIGAKTIEALFLCDPYVVVAALKSEAAGRYRYLALADPSQKVFLTGWLNRAYS